MIHSGKPRYAVKSRAGEGTCETIITDNYGREYRSISDAEAASIESSTHTISGGTYTLHPNGSISPRRHT